MIPKKPAPDLIRGLDRFCDRFRIAEVVLPACRSSCSAVFVATNFMVGRGHQLSVVTKCFQLPTKVMRTNAGLHADQARRHIGKPCFDPATRPLLTQHDCTAAVEADDVERVLADIDTDYGNCVVEIVRHSVLLVFGAPCQLRSLTGQEHAGPFSGCETTKPKKG
jgi:hypothetical protein